MNEIHQKIIHALTTNKSLSLKELQLITSYSRSGLRGRISELRKIGYNIQVRTETVKKYVMVKHDENNVDKILQWVHDTDNYNVPLEYEKLSHILNIPLNNLTTAMIDIHQMGMLQQITNTKAMIKKSKRIKTHN